MRNFIILLFTSFIFSCNQGAKPAEFDAHAGDDHSEELAQNVQSEKLMLNNGAKWKADNPTNSNVADLQKIANDFKAKPNPTSEDYQELNGMLGRGLNKMIQECKMEGPDHDALHLWLEPVLKQNAQLKDLTTSAKSKIVFDSLDHRLNIYHDYFQ